MKEIVNKNIQKNQTSTISVQNILNSITKEHVFRFLAIAFFGLITVAAIQINSPFVYHILTAEAIVVILMLVAWLSNQQSVKK